MAFGAHGQNDGIRIVQIGVVRVSLNDYSSALAQLPGTAHG